MADCDRAVSEVVGFVLVFTLVLSTVVVVYAVGFPGLEDRRDAERVANAERAFDVLADNVDDVREYGDPARATEIKLADAGLEVRGSTRLTVEITNLGSPPPRYSVELSPVVYSADDTRIVYEAGAVHRVQSDGGVLQRGPGMVFTEDGGTRTAVLPLVQTRSAGRSSVAGSSTVRLRTDLAVAEVLTAREAAGGPYDVAFTVVTTADRAPVWDRYLDAELSDAYAGVSDPCSVSGDTVTCTFSTDRLYVSVTRMDVTLS